MRESKQSRAVLLLVTAAVLWSLAGVLIKGVSLPALAVAGYRSAIALPVLLILFGRQAVDFSLRQWVGGFFYAATVTLFVAATKLTTAGNAILLQYTAPLYVALLSGWLLREPIRWFDGVTIAAVLAGMALFFFDRLSPGGMAGNMLAICSGIAYACLIVALRGQKDASPAGSAILGNLLTALVCLPWMVKAAPAGGDWIGLLLLGVFQIGISYACYVVAIRNVTAMEAVLIPVIEPILNPLWTLLWMGERLGPWAIWGGIVVLLAVLFRGIAGTRSPAGR